MFWIAFHNSGRLGSYSSVLHCSFMENIFLVKIPQKCKYTVTFCQNSEVSHTIKIQNFEHQNLSDYLYKKLFYLNRFLYFGVFKFQISACRFLYVECLLYSIYFGDFHILRFSTVKLRVFEPSISRTSQQLERKVIFLSSVE